MEIRVAKIVGTANDKTWSQVHEFKPEGGKLKTHGRLMAALAFKAKKEDLSISSFGTEIITRLQEMYYSNESESILKKVSQTIESLRGEFFNEVELQIVVMVQWGEGLYAGRSGEGQVRLRRGEAMVKLLTGEGVEVVSGKLEAEDKLVGGTKEFFKILPEEDLKTALEETEVSQVMERLAAIVHGEEKNSQAAGVVVKVESEREEPEVQEKAAGIEKEEGEEESKEERADERKKGGLGERLEAAVSWVGSLGGRRPGRRIWLRKGTGKRQKSAATIAIVLVLVFGLSLVLAGRKREKTKREAEYQAVVEEAGYKYDEAMGLVELNPLRAKSLLKESQERIKLYESESEEELSKELKELLEKIEVGLSQVQKEYALESADEWFDFGLVKEGFKGSDWEIEENEVLVWDEASKAVVMVDLESKASRIVVGGDEVSGGELVALAGERGMVAGRGGVTVVDVEEDEVVDEMGAGEWGKIEDAVGFGGNLYLLDRAESGQIWKYLGVESGLGSKSGYLKAESLDLSEAVSMAIDGSVWVLFSDGTIVKYTKGKKDAFGVTGLEQEFKGPTKIFTSPEVDNLYVLDQQKMRVVVIDKTGEYQAQYVWPGIAGVKDLVVSEELGKMFLLTGEKVFVIELKE